MVAVVWWVPLCSSVIVLVDAPGKDEKKYLSSSQ